MFTQSMQYTKDSRIGEYNIGHKNNEKMPPRIDKIHKKYSKVSNTNNNRF